MHLFTIQIDPQEGFFFEQKLSEKKVMSTSDLACCCIGLSTSVKSARNSVRNVSV
jgi:hypothetical protein